jgi:lauroyl/myristoyl acyltransferase
VSAAAAPDRQRSAIIALAQLAGRLPFLRNRLLENMRLGLGYEPPAGAAERFFHHWGWTSSNALLTFHHGVGATPATRELKFDDTFRVLDAAVAEGRGVILVAPHWAGHEIGAALISRTHPVTMLVRQTPTEERMARKLKWYRALGVEILLRPREASSVKDAVAYLKVLKAGKLLAITPDLLAGEQGIEARLFGRTLRLPAGAFALAMMAGAPMIRVSGRWESDSCQVIMFDRAPDIVAGRETAMRQAADEWCRWFEEKLREQPENWLFWLDKRWTRFLRTTPRGSG